MNSSWLSRAKIEQRLERLSNTSTLAEHYWLSQMYQRAVFCPTFAARDDIASVIRPTASGRAVVDACRSDTGVSQSDATLALYGYFFHHELLIDHEATDVTQVLTVLESDIFEDRLRFPFAWGRILHDKYNDLTKLNDLEELSNEQAWDLLDGTPSGVFQHGCFLTGPLGIVRSTEARWVPVLAAITRHLRKRTATLSQMVPFLPAKIPVVTAYAWIERHLTQESGSPSEWSSVLPWLANRQAKQARTDYADICPVLADCVLGPERTRLFESLLKTDGGKIIRERMRRIKSLKPLSSLPPSELAAKLDSDSLLQLLLVLPAESLVSCLDQLILSGEIDIPTSEVRVARKRPPSRSLCFQSEMSWLGIRPAHPEPFAALCSSILRAYSCTESDNELSWRLGSDPSRGLEITLTEFIRREGPDEAVSKLILASQPVATVICRELGLDLCEINPRTEKTIPRLLWKLGFEITRHDEVLARLNRRMEQFEEAVSQYNASHGEAARERIRAEGVNLFVSVEEFLDRVISFNVWLLSSDHWAETRFQYRVSDARRSVAKTLGQSIESSEGLTQWRANGENPLGTQLAYLHEFELWLEGLAEKVPVHRDVEAEEVIDHCSRPFPFRHLELWADANVGELQRYTELFKKASRLLSQADVAGVRNGLDHQRDPSRFPTEEALLACITRLRHGVRAAEQSRIYPVTYWIESSTKRVFGASEHTFRNGRGESFTIFRPATVSSLPKIPMTHPVVFAPVNFLGSADSLLFFRRLGESEYSRYWSNYPRISRVVAEPDESAVEQVLNRDVEGSEEAPGTLPV